jgi:hypothetical protein
MHQHVKNSLNFTYLIVKLCFGPETTYKGIIDVLGLKHIFINAKSAQLNKLYTKRRLRQPQQQDRYGTCNVMI